VSTLMNNIKAVIFDLDNTLIDRQRAFTEMLKRKLPQILEPSRHSEINQMIEDILKWDANGTVSRYQCFSTFIKEYHVTSITAEELDQGWSKESGSTAYLFDDVIDTLIALRPKYKLAILSNGNSSSQRRKLATINIDHLMDYTLVSGEFGVNKPDPLIFQHVAAQLAVEPHECVYIGDNYQIDVLGSKNAGMQSIYVDRYNQPQKDTLTIHHIKELLNYL